MARQLGGRRFSHETACFLTFCYNSAFKEAASCLFAIVSRRNGLLLSFFGLLRVETGCFLTFCYCFASEWVASSFFWVATRRNGLLPDILLFLRVGMGCFLFASVMKLSQSGVKGFYLDEFKLLLRPAIVEKFRSVAHQDWNKRNNQLVNKIFVQ